jgi:deoxyribonuclease V
VNIQPLHSWKLTPTEAVQLQRRFASRVDAHTPLGRCELIAGADVSYERFGKTLYAGVVVLRLPDLSIVEEQRAILETEFPYIPGLLSFREAPALLAAFAKVESEPGVVMLDGHGFSHPRRFGLACHIGLWLDRPCLGCAKSRLIGTFGRLGRKVGARAALVDREEVIGAVVRTKTGVKPVFASVGHRIDLDSAVRTILAAGAGYRVPEPTRLADQHVNALRRARLAENSGGV